MFTIETKHVTWSKENGKWEGCTFASDIGLPPGEWPTVVLVAGVKEAKMFHMETLPHPSSIAEANEHGHYYRSSDGAISLLIAND